MLPRAYACIFSGKAGLHNDHKVERAKTYEAGQCKYALQHKLYDTQLDRDVICEIECSKYYCQNDASDTVIIAHVHFHVDYFAAAISSPQLPVL